MVEGEEERGGASFSRLSEGEQALVLLQRIFSPSYEAIMERNIENSVSQTDPSPGEPPLDVEFSFSRRPVPIIRCVPRGERAILPIPPHLTQDFTHHDDETSVVLLLYADWGRQHVVMRREAPKALHLLDFPHRTTKSESHGLHRHGRAR